MRSRAFRVGPANYYEFLAVKPFGFSPKAAVSWRIGRVDRLRNNTLKTELAGVLQDQFAIACLISVELNAGLVEEQWLQKHLALDKLKAETSQPSRCKRSKA